MVEKKGVSLPVFMAVLIFLGLLAAFGLCLVFPQGAPARVLGAADSGSTVSAGVGSTFQIKLDENPTTGFSWNASVTPGLTVVDSKYVPSGSTAIGAGGTHEWTIKAVGKGEQAFSAVYKRPWEPLTGSENTYSVKIIVT